MREIMNHCDKGFKNCGECRLEAIQNSDFNPWLPNNEKIVDFIRWYEVGYFIVSFGILIFMFGYLGLFLALMLYGLNHLQGGPVADGQYQSGSSKIEYRKCILGHQKCIHKAVKL